MTVAQVRQWFYVIPLLSIEAVQDGWNIILPFISREAAIAKAARTAKGVENAGELVAIYKKQCIGYFRMLLEEREGENRTWCVDLVHNVHFRGHWTKVPDFESVQRIRFTALSEPLPGGDPTRFADYLVIEYTRP